jgi:hypothetical protein
MYNDPEQYGTAAEIAAFVAKHAGRCICIPRHVGGDTFAARCVAFL